MNDPQPAEDAKKSTANERWVEYFVVIDVRDHRNLFVKRLSDVSLRLCVFILFSALILSQRQSKTQRKEKRRKGAKKGGGEFSTRLVLQNIPPRWLGSEFFHIFSRLGDLGRIRVQIFPRE